MQNTHNKFPAIEDEQEQDDFVPWTAEQAEAWRAANPTPSLWRYWWVQVAVGVLVVVLASLLQQLAGWKFAVVPSAIYGVLAVLLPSALSVAGVLRSFHRLVQARRKVGSAGLGFATVMLWEGCKVLATICLLALAPVLLKDWMSWPAMLIGFIVTLKAYWWAWLRNNMRAR